MTPIGNIADIVAGSWREGDDRLVPIGKKPIPHAARKLHEVRRDQKLIPAGLAETFQECRMGRAPWPLFVWGGVGGGKTRFGLCVHDIYDGQHWDFADLAAEYVQLRRGELLDCDSQLTGGYQERVVREIEWIDALARPRMFVLDDVGRRSDTAAGTNREVISRFLDRRENKPTILLSNLPPNGLAPVYDERVASRCRAGTVIEVSVGDRRRAPTP